MRAQLRRAEESIVDVEFCLVFPHEALSVPVMRRVLGDTLRRLGADEDGVSDLLLAVTEACTNVLKHGTPGPRYEIVAHRPAGPPDPGAATTSAAGSRSGRPPRAGPCGCGARACPAPPPSPRPARAAKAPRPVGRRQAHPPLTEDQVIAMLPESGRGLAIMRACVDDVTLRTDPDVGTVVSLEKRMAWRDDALLSRPAELPDEAGTGRPPGNCPRSGSGTLADAVAAVRHDTLQADTPALLL